MNSETDSHPVGISEESVRNGSKEARVILVHRVPSHLLPRFYTLWLMALIIYYCFKAFMLGYQVVKSISGPLVSNPSLQLKQLKMLITSPQKLFWSRCSAAVFQKVRGQMVQWRGLLKTKTGRCWKRVNSSQIDCSQPGNLNVVHVYIMH